MKNVRPPQILGNLYRDMRDRRLLFPALALVVAALAVPILLKSQSTTTSPPTEPAGVTSRSASEAMPAVVTQQLGVTNYRKRLNRLQTKNPFHQQYTTPPKSTQLQVTSPDVTSTAPPPSTSGGGSSSTSVSSSTTSQPPLTNGSPSTSTGGTSSASSPPTTVKHTKPTFHLYTYRVAVKVGEPGKLSDRPEVSSLALLPSKSRPILSFLEANGKQALFLVSTDVDSVKGEGRCVPKPADCQYIVMRTGDKASFHYAPSNKRFNLVLKDIHAVEIGHKPPTKAAKASGKVDLKPKLPLLGQG